MLEGDDISRLLDILGNRNRRRIIQLLRQKPCFVTEISDRLMISPKAVIEHLQLMEREQILLSKNDRSRRKYYYLSRDFKVVIDLENIPAALLPEEIAVIDKKNEFFSLLAATNKLLESRDSILSDLEYIERDIDRKISDLKVTGKDILASETEFNLVLALSSCEMTLGDLEEFSGIDLTELSGVLDGLAAKGIVKRTGEYYKVCDIYAE
ncbi:transcriptional regulator, ArsR family [Methanolacinia petrolearia DSM 11571]|uniref:Transcriptional regulator, ArsR family n=1 Tax=Methanolacinia petrolearia (strain DSM 11571 / OCM 486 / SEBR 4847) TaxID=679926 RepID=E1RDR7_METP4|nr:ArsR family transcriptional regulator [Methanolacinia petrolearia]ADN37104.1 transcriptional regulator, ArsR family [Methanolacinia petrolearia DSM 11571]